MSTSPSEKQLIKARSLISFVLTALLVLGGVSLLRAYIIKPFIVQGVSMYPTFNNWHYLIIDRYTYNFIRSPERGEVVVFKAPIGKARFFVKRVIALPGETITIQDHTITIKTSSGDMITLNEPYVLDTKRRDANINITLGKNEYYMLGDNRLESADSRYWGPLNKEAIAGRAILRLLPLNKISWLPGDYDYEDN